MCGELGIGPLGSNGKCSCPWHDDRDPSFTLYVNTLGVQRWACSPCGASGDVYDLIQRVEGVGFIDSLLRAEELLEAMPAQRELSLRAAEPFDRRAAERLLAAAHTTARENFGWLGVALGMVDDGVSREEREMVDAILSAGWVLGLGPEGEAVFPHLDYSGQLVGLKFRALDGRRWTFPGSRFAHLYGGWHAREHRNVLLCEGETDTIWADLQSPGVDVLGLPSGAGKFMPEWSELRADVYYLAFDGDDAGRDATAVWQRALAGLDVRVCPVPEGEDIRSAAVSVSDLLPQAT